MKRLLTSIAILLGVALIGAYAYFQPHLTMYHIIVAARSGDDQTLREAVDFPAVREHLKASITQEMLKQMASTSNADNPFAALGMLFAQKLADTMIDAMVTPAMLAQAVRNAVQLDSKDSPTDSQILYRILARLPGHYSDASTYVLQFEPSVATSPIRFVLRRNLLTFRLTRVDINMSDAEKQITKRDRSGPSVATRRPRVEASASEKESPAWLVVSTRSPIDDTVTARAWRDADEPIRAAFGSVTPAINVVCEPDGNLYFYVDAKRILDYKYDTGRSNIRFRFDQSLPETAAWSTSKDHQAIFSPRPREFVPRLLKATRLVVEFTPLSESPQTATFTLTGLSETFPQAKNGCRRSDAMHHKDSVQSTVSDPDSEEDEHKRAEEQKRVEEAKREDERKQRAAAAERERQQQEVVRKQREAEETARRLDTAARAAQQKLIDDWRARIRTRIKDRVVVPPNMQGNPEARFEVVLLPGGEVLSATLMKSSGNPAYDAAVERAIMAAQPLPVPTDSDLFQEHFREFPIAFRPRE